MKYQKTKTWFRLPRLGIVKPFNGEKRHSCMRSPDVSWSHGFTHLVHPNGSYAGFCGTQYFEDNAVKVTPNEAKA